MKHRTNESLTGERIVGVFQLHAPHLRSQVHLDIDALGTGRCVEEAGRDFRSDVRLFTTEPQVVEDFLRVFFI